MEINFESGSLKYFNRLCGAAFTHEETTEIIVPDAMPDVSAVLDADGIVCMRGKEAQNDKIIISGITDIYVLYKPDASDGIRRLAVQLPFEASYDCQGLTGMGRLIAVVRLCGADARVINSRKLLVRVELCIFASAYSQEELSYIPAAASAENLELLSSEYELFPVVDVTEKTFSISESFSMPSAKPPLGQLLRSRVCLNVDEAEGIGRKLIIKGSAGISAVYSSADSGSVNGVDFRAPFSVIMEVDAEGEDVDYENTVMLTGVDISQAESGAVNVEIGAVAQTAVRKPEKLCCAVDAYSVSNAAVASVSVAPMDTQYRRDATSETLRLNLDSSKPVRSVIDSSCYISRPREENGAVRANITARAICIDDDEKPFIVSARSEVTRQLINDDDKSRRSGWVNAGVLYAAPSPEGAELRIPLSYELLCSKRGELRLLTGVSLDEATPVNTKDMPSVLVFRAGENDTLWELGKRFKTTRSDIRASNGMQPDKEISAGELILVSKQR